MTLSLIVNADDFGLTTGVNRSVLACHLAGSVTSTTLMANMDAAEDAATIAREYPSLGVGLHFNLTTGLPLAPAASVGTLLDDDGRLLTRGRLLRRAMSGTLRSEHVENEFVTQLARLRALGVQLTHVDSHQHVHAVPQIFEVVSRASAAAGLPLRLTWGWPGRVSRKSLRRRFSEAVLQTMTRRCVSLKPANVRSNDGLCSVFDLNETPASLSEASYLRLLDVYRGGVVELMVHPAEVDEELAEKTVITEISDVENRLLRSRFLREYVIGRHGRMATYRELA